MSEREIPVTEDELHAYLDNELPAERCEAVKAWLAAHPDDAARVAAWRALGDELRDHYGSVIDEPLPQRLDPDRLVTRYRNWIWGAVAAMLLAFVGGGSAGWIAHRTLGGEAAPLTTLRDDATTAHRLYATEIRHPIEVASNEQHLLPWLSRRVGAELRAPDLTKYDLKLMGGRLLPGPIAPAALFMYETADGAARVSLYCTPFKGPASTLVYKEAGNTASVEWTEPNFGWVVSGPATMSSLKLVAADAQEQLEYAQP